MIIWFAFMPYEQLACMSLDELFNFKISVSSPAKCGVEAELD